MKYPRKYVKEIYDAFECPGWTDAIEQELMLKWSAVDNEPGWGYLITVGDDPAYKPKFVSLCLMKILGII